MRFEIYPAILALVVSATAAAAVDTTAQPPTSDNPDAAGPDSGPVLEVEATEFDLGIVTRGEVVSHSFTVQNTGSEPLVIEGIKSSCHCTVPEHPDELAPGESGSVKATIHSEYLRGKSRTNLAIISNASEPRTDVMLELEVREFVAAVPGKGTWNYVRFEEEGTIRQYVFADKGEEFEVLEVTSPFPYMDATFHLADEEERHSDGPDHQWIVDLTLRETAPVGAINGYVKIVTDHPAQAQTLVPVGGFVRPIAAVTPPRGRIGQVELSGPRTINFHLKNFASAPLMVKNIEVDVEGMAATATSGEWGRTYIIELVLDDTMPKGPFRGTMTITTDHPDEPQIEVPLVGEVL